jgi:hypothetical protein
MPGVCRDLDRKVELFHVQHAKARQKTLSHYLIKIVPQLRDLLVWASGAGEWVIRKGRAANRLK